MMAAPTLLLTEAQRQTLLSEVLAADGSPAPGQELVYQDILNGTPSLMLVDLLGELCKAQPVLSPDWFHLWYQAQFLAEWAALLAVLKARGGPALSATVTMPTLAFVYAVQEHAATQPSLVAKRMWRRLARRTAWALLWHEWLLLSFPAQ